MWGGQDYLLPEEYVQTMRASMLDKCPVSTYKQVCDVFLAELGCLPHEVFVKPTKYFLRSLVASSFKTQHKSV